MSIRSSRPAVSLGRPKNNTAQRTTYKMNAAANRQHTLHQVQPIFRSALKASSIRQLVLAGCVADGPGRRETQALAPLAQLVHEQSPLLVERDSRCTKRNAIKHVVPSQRSAAHASGCSACRRAGVSLTRWPGHCHFVGPKRRQACRL